ncbi:hypothetical protein LOAG_01453 [Loa loa]|uniref:Uncharacterized protein n=1 Tax=Loa loa TaxID=7209 RepID=A0A1S0U9L9_LOALO|nr:hypothetical protein LOAG_01453 [Loa loa]EFO27033.1 hypothetical protein LOAG_01453 [Loa loa]
MQIYARTDMTRRERKRKGKGETCACQASKSERVKNDSAKALAEKSFSENVILKQNVTQMLCERAQKDFEMEQFESLTFTTIIGGTMNEAKSKWTAAKIAVATNWQISAKNWVKTDLSPFWNKILLVK